ncbi:MAG: hypothetical protein JXC36_09685, partial [Candidatus Atribacteria bacterium]|nr:hypothetical protein [Candidatus Atribacteria bacterium]
TTKVGNRIFTTNYNYDIMDRITGLTYPNEKTVTYTYNKLGEITGMPGYLDGAPTYEDGLLKTYTASNNNTTTFDYDDNGRLSSLSHTNTEEIKSYAFTYDNADNIIQRNGDHYDYDEENRLTNAYLNGSFQADVEDDEQTVGVIREDMKGGKQLEFNLEFVLDDPEIVELDYAAGSIGVDLEGLYEVTRIELKAENPDNRVIPEAIRVFASETALEDYEEISDFTARFEEKDGETVIAIKLLPPVTARLIKVKTNFDDRNADFSWRDKAEFRNGVDEIIKVYYNVEQRDEAYTYDDLGNRVEETITLDGTKTKTTKYYPQCSRLMTNGKYVYTYDANGNITGKGTHVAIEGSTVKVNEVETAYWESVTSSIDGITIAEEGQWWEYEYDLLNRMVEVSKNGETKATYSYNEAGLMVKKVGSRGTIYSTYSQNGKLLYEEYEDTETYRQYVYAFGRQFAREEGTIEETETVPVYTATDRIYYSTDHLGSVTAVTDETGDVLWKNDYTPFGELADPENTFDGAQVYAGHFWDEDAELYYAKARWYDAETGRFTTVDPVKDGVNWYVYCGGNPIGYYDYYGLWPTAPPVGDVTLDGVTVENERSHIPLGSDGDKSLGWAQHGVTVNGVENFVGPAQTHEDSNPKPNIPQGDAYPEIGPKPKNYYDQLQPDFSFSPLKPQYNPNLFLETPDNLKYEPDLFLDELAFYCNRFAWNVAILRGVNPGFRSWCRIGQEYRFGGSVTDNPTEDTAGWIVYIGQDKKGNEYIGHITYYECHSGDSSYYVWETTGYNIPVPVEYDIGKDPAKYNIYKDVKFITLGKAPNIPVADFKYTYDHDIINLDWSARKSRRNDYRTPHLLKDSKLLEKYPRLKKHLPKEKKDER